METGNLEEEPCLEIEKVLSIILEELVLANKSFTLKLCMDRDIYSNFLCKF